jgi:hypothetical protein
VSIEYRKTDCDDPEISLEHAVLEAITKGRPYVLVTADISGYPDISLALSVGGGIDDLQAAEALLSKALDAARKVET